jgi:hypothetical protein
MSNYMTPLPHQPPKKLLSTKAYMDQFIWKETEIELHPNSTNKEDGLDQKEAMYTTHSLPQRAQQTSPN